MNAAGSSVRAAPAAESAVTMPPIPIDCRKRSGKTVSELIATATVTALNATVRPAVRIVTVTASATSRPAATSSRKRETMNRL